MLNQIPSRCILVNSEVGSMVTLDIDCGFINPLHQKSATVRTLVNKISAIRERFVQFKVNGEFIESNTN